MIKQRERSIPPSRDMRELYPIAYNSCYNTYMLVINIKRILHTSKLANLHQLAEKLGFSFGNYIYKFSNHPEKVKKISLETLSAIVKEVAVKKKVKPGEVKISDIFDWKE